MRRRPSAVLIIVITSDNILQMKKTYISPLGPSAEEVRAEHLRDPEYRAELERRKIALTVARLVIMHRTRTKMSQQALAKRMGTSVPAISRLEGGIHTPSMKTLGRVARARARNLKVKSVPAKRTDRESEMSALGRGLSKTALSVHKPVKPRR